MSLDQEVGKEGCLEDKVFRINEESSLDVGEAIFLYDYHSGDYAAFNLTRNESSFPIADEDFDILIPLSPNDLSPQERANLDSFKKNNAGQKTYQTA